ncbi:MAG: hypothetical protein IPJ87_03620 [Flavobacteriales bacterium]|nr:hypothetical protein [Flavobacteriales bacterium]MBK7940955.1 hypothetical protein [Flavobacteriales bacterium]
MKHLFPAALVLVAIGSRAQAPIPPPVSTDLNSGMPLTWGIEAYNTVDWTWAPTVGYGGTGGLIMDCGTCMGYEETTFWAPWLDLSSDPFVNVTFNCAIIGGAMMWPPPVWARRDGVGGACYLYRYGVADLIPPPDEVIPSTLNPFPPLDPNNVQWVSITYPFQAGLNADSVRIGNTSTFAPATEANDLLVLRTQEAVTFRSLRPVDRLEVIDLSGRVLRQQEVGGTEALLPLDGLAGALHLVRLWRSGVPAVVRLAR